MRFLLTTLIGKDTRFEFVSAQQPVGCRHSALALDPCRFDGGEPRTFPGQRAAHDADAHGALLPLPIVWAKPVPHGVPAMPGGMVPAQQPRREAVGRQSGGAPRQQIDGHRTPAAPRDQPPPHLVGWLGPRPSQPPLTGQRCGSRRVGRQGQRRQRLVSVCRCPGLGVGRSQPAPPDCVTQAQRPCRLGHGRLAQLGAPFCFRAYAGSGRVIQWWARLPETRKRRRATRMASALPSRGVSPSAKRPSAARARGPRLVGLPNVRGL